MSTTHADYPHNPGYLHGCAACELTCHCPAGAAQCVWAGHESDDSGPDLAPDESSTLAQLRRMVDDMARTVSTIGDCDCDEDESWPCEAHCVTLAQYEGASLRTADELLCVVLDELTMLACQSQDTAAHVAHADASECAAAMWHEDEDDRVAAGMFQSDVTMNGGWAEDRDTAEWCSDLVHRMESELPERYRSAWDDGWRLVKITGGPLDPDGPETLDTFLEGALDVWVNAELRYGSVDPVTIDSVTILTTCGGPDIRTTLHLNGSAEIVGRWGSDTYTRHVPTSSALESWAESYTDGITEGVNL